LKTALFCVVEKVRGTLICKTILTVNITRAPGPDAEKDCFASQIVT